MKFAKLILPLVLLAVLQTAGTAQYVEYKATDDSKLWFDGTSTLHDFTCHAQEINANVTFAPTLLDGEPGDIQKGKVVIPVEQIKHENDGLNKNMYKVLEPETYPEIEFVWDSIEVSGQSDTALNANVSGNLTIKGETREITVPVTIKDTESADTLKAVGNYTLYLSNFDIKRPSFFLGTLKVGDEFQIYFDLALVRTERYKELTQQ